MMRVEETWENPGRDRITLEELLELHTEGYEFVVCSGHIVSAVMEY